MDDLNAKTDINMGSEKSFGVVFGLVALVVGLYPLVGGASPNYYCLAAAVFFISFAFFLPKIFKWPNKIWFKFGILLGLIISPIVMFLIFAITFVPLALLFKILRKDPLNRKWDEETNSYWVHRDTKMQSMKRQF
ncbi:MAG: SxtJ family membrane protein [Hellea sp.]